MPPTKSSYKKYYSIAAIALVVILALGVYLWHTKKPTSQVIVSAPMVEATTTPPAPQFFSVLDGTVVSSTALTTPTVLGVMIDNHPDARPPSGIGQARIMYEAMAEGGITRLMAIFNAADQVVKVGPVRSSRPYYLDWFREYGDAAYLHCGGSPQALQDLVDYGMFNVDQFYNGQYFWRDNNRDAPHNLYTSTDNWQRLLANKGAGHNDVPWQGWLFDESGAAPTTTASVTGVDIAYTDSYDVSWDYKNGRYVRSINNKPHVDDKGKQLTADDIIIEDVPMQTIDNDGRKEMDTVGTGQVRIFKDGAMIRGTWKKETPTARTRFYDSNNQEIPLQPGQIWVEIVPTGTTVDVTS